MSITRVVNKRKQKDRELSEKALKEFLAKGGKVKEIPEDKRKNYPKKDGGVYETFLDVEQAESFASFEFLKACEMMGITKDLGKDA